MKNMKDKCFICNKLLRPLSGWGNLKFWLERPCFARVYLTERDELIYFTMCLNDALWTMNNIGLAETLLYSKLQALEKNDS